MERHEVYKLIDGEREYQDITWSPRREENGTPDEEKPVAEWINYIEFHLAKAKSAIYYLDKEAALAEIRKITALGVKTMEIHGCPERELKNFLFEGKTYKIDVGTINENDIEEYIQKVADSFKQNKDSLDNHINDKE